VGSAVLEVEGRRVEGLPLFDGSFTGPEGITGRLGPLGSDAEIGVTAGGPHGPAQQELREQRRSGRHRAIVTVSHGDRPGLAAINGNDFKQPFGPPVLQLPSEASGDVQAWTAAGATARVVAHATVQQADALNVVAVVEGARPDLPPLGVVTPRSGWWSCASERGGGLACWLEILRALREARPLRTVRLVATSGHELDFIGFDAYLTRHAEAATEAAFWLHLGANIGAADPDEAILRTSNEALRGRAIAAFDRHGAGPYTAAPAGVAPAGEARDVVRRGGRFVSLVGANAYFHLPSDRYPEATNAYSVTRYAAACAELMLEAACEASA
jgi:hypothetical protein